MKPIQTPSAVPNKFGAGKSGFTDGDPSVGLEATDLEARWFDQVQQSVILVQEAAALVASDDPAQMRDAILKLIEMRVGDYALDTGAVNAAVVAMNPAVSAYTNGMEVKFRIKFANTGPVTLNAGAGAVPLVRDDGVALVAGDLPLNILVNAVYDLASNKFLVNSLVSSQALAKSVADTLYATKAQATETQTGTAEVATQAETDTGNDDVTIVTPKKLKFGFGASFGANGYLKFPSWLGGLIFQWGVTPVLGTSVVSVLFPLAFPTACKFVILSNQTNSNISLGTISITTTGFFGYASINGNSHWFFAVGN